MKQFAGLMSKVSTCVAVLAAVSFVNAVQAEVKEGKALVRGARGSADFSQGAGGFKKLGSNSVLTPGAVVRTSPDAEVDLFLDRNGPAVRVASDSVLGVDRLSYDKTGAEVVTDTLLNLQSGRIMGRVNKMSPASKYEVKTPTALFSLRAADGPLDYDIEATGRITIKNGEANVTYGGKSYTVRSGETFDPTIPGVRPATPEELKAVKPPILAQPPSLVRMEPGSEVYVSPLTGNKAQSSEDDGDYYPPDPDAK